MDIRTSLERLYNNSPGESWGEYFARLEHAYPVAARTPLQNIRFTSEFQTKETEETND